MIELQSSPVTILNIPLAQLRESPMNARKNFNKEKLEELADSIRAKGVLTPLLVRPQHDADTTPERYEILAGARRFRAAKMIQEKDSRLVKVLAGHQELATVPCVAREVDDATALEIITIENLQREDLSELEEAHGFQALLDLGKYDVAELAKRVGKSASYIYQRVKLVELAPEAKKALVEQKISAGHAILIARLQPREQAEAMKEVAERAKYRPLSVRELGHYIQTYIHLDLTKAPWKLDDATLVPKAGACDGCPKRAKNDCEDPACYEGKMQAHFQRIEKTPGSGLVVRISARSGDLKDGVYGMYGWRRAKQGSCPATAVGLPVDSGYAMEGKIERGKPIGICIDKKCQVHWKANAESGGARYHRPPSELKRERRHKAELQRRGRLFRAVTAKPYDSTDEETRQIVDWMADRLDHDHAKRLCEAMGWEPVAGSYGQKSYEAALRRQLNGMKIGEIEQWMLWLVVAAEDLYFGAYNSSIPKSRLLEQCAKRAKVSVPAVVHLERSGKIKTAESKSKAKPKPHASAKPGKAVAKAKRKKRVRSLLGARRKNAA